MNEESHTGIANKPVFHTEDHPKTLSLGKSNCNGDWLKIQARVILNAQKQSTSTITSQAKIYWVARDAEYESHHLQTKNWYIMLGL